MSYGNVPNIVEGLNSSVPYSGQALARYIAVYVNIASTIPVRDLRGKRVHIGNL